MLILLVEDELLVRDLVRAFLRRGGFDVIEAGSSEEALELPSDRFDAIDLLLTDVVLPGIDGTKLAAQLRARRADLPVLYMSGNVVDSIGGEAFRQPNSAFISKPFTRAGLLGAVQTLLGITV